MLTWIDVETTGLDPTDGKLLEVAMIITTDTLDVVAKSSFTILYRLGDLEKMFKAMPDHVQKMHIESGLWSELQRGGSPISEAEFQLLTLYRTFVDEPTPMAGSTVSFDRAWLKHYMPKLESKFHYRNIDVSTLKELNARWKFCPPWTNPNKAHRALLDLHKSIGELRYYQGFIG